MFIEVLQYGGWCLIWVILFLAAVSFGLVYQLNKDPYENLREHPNRWTNMFACFGCKTWSDANGLPETVIYWTMVPLWVASIFWDFFFQMPSLWYYLTVIKELFTDEVARSSILNMRLVWNVLFRSAAIWMSTSILLTGYTSIEWPHGAVRFAFGHKLRVLNEGLHFMVLCLFAFRRAKPEDKSKPKGSVKKGEDRPVEMETVHLRKIGRVIVVHRDELRASVVLTEGNMSSEEARKVLTTEPLPTTLAAAGAAEGSGGAKLQFPHNFYFVKWNLITYLGTSPTTLDRHLITSVDDQFQADWRRFTSVLQYDQARFVQGNVFLFADQTNLVAKMNEYAHDRQIPPATEPTPPLNATEAWTEYQNFMATQPGGFDIRVFEQLKEAREYEKMATMIKEKAPNSLACRILMQFGIIVTFFGIENGIEEPGIVKEREALKQAEVKIRRDFLEGGAEMRQALGTILHQYGLELKDWTAMVDDKNPNFNPGLKLEIMRAMMEVWRFNKSLGAVTKGDKIIMTGQHAGILPDVITASIAAQQTSATAQPLPPTAGSAAGTATTPAPASTTPARSPRPPQPNRGQGRSRGRRP